MPDDFAPELEAAVLSVDVDGFEGPLDVLLTLARTQKVDLRQISVLALAEQYLAFVEAAKRRRVELAADYLVMAAWLAYLKSRLLLPPEESEEGPSAEDLAAHLAFQLERLEAMRRAAARLMARDQLGKDMFARGQPEQVTVARRTEHTATLLDLMRAYARIKTREDYRPVVFEPDRVISLDQALHRMRSLIGSTISWTALSQFLPPDPEPRLARSAVASAFAAMLELAKSGEAEIRQTEMFGEITLKGRPLS